MRKLKSGFYIRSHDPKNLLWWIRKRDSIDFNPPFQRRSHLWSRTDKAFLIDSILNDYDIPKLYVADFNWSDSPLNTKQLPYAIIDGKQRFEAIFDFFDGKIQLDDDFEYLEEPNLKLGGLGFRDLKANYAEIAEKFENFHLTVFSVQAYDESPIKELFVRLNRGKSLTGAEVRNAMAGPAPDIIREITIHAFFKTYIGFSTKRGSDINAAAKLLVFEFNREPKETKKTNLDRFVKQREKAGPEDRDRLQLAGRLVLETLDILTDIFLPRDPLLRSSGLLPVYYWFIHKLEEIHLQFVREFLIYFEHERAQNRQKKKEKPDDSNIDPELLLYDSLNRSTNDLKSHQSRIEILNSRYVAFMERVIAESTKT